MSVKNEPHSARQKNGEIVMGALQDLVEPATYMDVVNHIANRQNVLVSSIKDPVKSVLDKGVEYGFIQKQGARYCTDGMVMAAKELVGEEQPCDRCCRRRPINYCLRRRPHVRRCKSRRKRSCRRR